MKKPLPIDFDADFHYWLNRIRADPTIIVPNLKDMLSRFEGNMLRPRSDSINRFTKFTYEGPRAVHEAIDYLTNKAPRDLKPLVWSEELRSSCRDHVNDIGPKGK